MYLIKTKGTKDIGDYLQIRDLNLGLIAHICMEKSTGEIADVLILYGISPEFFRLVEELPYGRITKII